MNKFIRKILDDKKKFEIISWEEFQKKSVDMLKKDNIYRGSLSTDNLETGIEKATNNWSQPIKYLPIVEKNILRDFIRRFPGDENVIPDVNDKLYCFALMQHFGAPTRLFDWTYSPYIAAFFGLEKYLKAKKNHNKKNNEEELYPTIWEINTKIFEVEVIKNLTEREKKLLNEFDIERSKEAFDTLFIKSKSKFVFTANPYRLNSRLILQNGLFLLASDISHSFEINFKSIPNWEKYIMRYFIKPSDIKIALESLNKMNVNHYVLFPGLDGFSKSYFFNSSYYFKKG